MNFIKNSRWFLLMSWLLLLGQLQAQNRPVQATMVFSPPYTLSLADYSSASAQKLRLSLLLRDATSPVRPVKLRFVIEGAGITIRTKESFLRSSQPLPIQLIANLPSVISGANAQFRQYFNPVNLEVLGTNPAQFMRSKRLPEGIYRWRVEVLDYNLLRPLNNAQVSQQTLWMVLAKPPIVNLPQPNQKLRATNYGMQNVVFQWLNRAASSPNSAFSTEYHVRLYEVYEPNARVHDARTAPRTLLYQNTLPLTNTTLIYNHTFPALTPGKRYLFQVQARDSQGRDLFENQGFSQIVVFQYGDECLPPTGIKAEALSPESIRLSWQNVAGSHTGYKIRYRRAGSNDDWTETTAQLNNLTLADLQAEQNYEYEVSSVCGQLDGTNWARGNAKTKAPNPANFVCGMPQGEYDLSNQEPLGSLQKGDIVQAGGYRVKVRHATGSNGQFSGVGIAQVPFGNTLVKLKVGFNDIFINAEKKMLRGQIYAARNKWKAMAFATQLPVDAWRIGQDGKVEIKQGGNWKRMPTGDGKDYMLVDKATQKKLFVDRNGKPDIPLEDRDYTNLNPQEIVDAAKKLQQEAEEAIADGRYGDALKLIAKAEELLDSVKDKVKKVVGFAKVVLKVIKEMVKEKQDSTTMLLKNTEEEVTAMKRISQKINKGKVVVFPGKGKGDLGAIAYLNTRQKDTGVVNNERKALLMKRIPELKKYEVRRKTYLSNRRSLITNYIGFVLVMQYTNADKLEDLVNIIKTELNALYIQYEALTNKNDTSKIETQLKTFIEKLIAKEKATIINQD